MTDTASYWRHRALAAERRVEFLKSYREQLERLLGTALRVATGGTEVSALALLDALEEVDGIERHPDIIAVRKGGR